MEPALAGSVAHRALLLHHPRGVWVRDLHGVDVEVLVVRTGPLVGQGVEPFVATFRARGQDVPAKPAVRARAPCVARCHTRLRVEVGALPGGE